MAPSGDDRYATAVTCYHSEDPVEDGLIDAIRRAPANDHARSVYRDWLEQHGHTDRLAFLQDEVVADVLVPKADAPWRAVVASPPIRNCPRTCGGHWSQLETTGPGLDVRLGRDLFSWLSLGISLAASSHEATVPAPPEGEWFQL